MIEIEKAKNEFINHIQKAEINNPKTEIKKEHTFRVLENCKQIATKLELTKEQVELAQLIGLLHDIGRFEQYKINNKGIKFDHGEEGVKILKNNKYIRNYIADDKYDNIIFTAICEHNKYELSKNLDKEQELFCKIVKDADKLDIIYEAICIYWQEKKQIKQIETGHLSPQMLEDFYSQKLSNNINRTSQTDQILRFCSFIYDLNFKCSFENLKETDNMNKMIDRFEYKIPETKQEMIKIKEIVNKYISDKINN